MEYLKEKYKNDIGYIEKVLIIYSEMYKQEVLVIILRLILSIKYKEIEIFSKSERKIIENNNELINKLNCDVYYI